MMIFTGLCPRVCDPAPITIICFHDIFAVIRILNAVYHGIIIKFIAVRVMPSAVPEDEILIIALISIMSASFNTALKYAVSFMLFPFNAFNCSIAFMLT